MRVLVTGGAGYIGSTAVEIMRAQGYEISILDDCSTGHADNIPAGVRFMQGSLLNRTEIADALTQCDAVMHFAGKSLVGESVEKPDLYYSVNVDGSRNLLDEMHRNGVKKIVFSSSAATYGEPQAIPILETAPTAPTNPYGATKLRRLSRRRELSLSPAPRRQQGRGRQRVALRERAVRHAGVAGAPRAG